MIKRYSDLRSLHTLEERFRYLKIGGGVGVATFGFDRHVNQAFYRSREWKAVRNHVIYRDEGCDLGIEGYEINGMTLVHHMNPMSIRDISQVNDTILDPEYLITCTHKTHNAIHFGDERLLPKEHIPRHAGDTKLW